MPVPRKPLIFDLTEVDTIVVVYKGGKSSIVPGVGVDRTTPEIIEILESMQQHLYAMCQPPSPREHPLPGGSHTPAALRKA